MLLYHGTSERVARDVLKHGLGPRDDTGGEGNWEDHPSAGGMVYLTAAYAPFFAMNASNEGERWAVIEIDTDLLDEDNLRPDEDFLEQITRSPENRQTLHNMGVEHCDEGDILALDASMEERTRWIRDHIEFFGPYWGNGEMWEKSIEGIGNCAHIDWIGPEAITRVGLFDPTSNEAIAMLSLDPSITLMNYLICKNKYTNLTRWFMGDDVHPAWLLGAAMSPQVLKDNPKVAESIAPQLKDMQQLLRMRDGWELLLP